MASPHLPKQKSPGLGAGDSRLTKPTRGSISASGEGGKRLRPAVLGLSDCSPAAGTSSFGNESKRNNKPQRGYPEYN
jgi:hypothetical protein